MLMPMGVPGLGKSTLVESVRGYCMKNGISFLQVSSDDTRREKIDELMSKNKKLTLDEAFQRSGKSAGSSFFKTLENMMKTRYKRQEANEVIFIDKNHPPNVWDKTVNGVIRASCPPGIELRVVAVVPHCRSRYHYKKTESSPFSYLCLLQCMSRALKRSDHPTITSATEPAKVVEIVHDFASFYKGVRFDTTLKVRAQVDGVLKLPFTQEDNFDPTSYENDLLPLSSKIMHSYKGERLEFCRSFVKLLKDFDKSVLVHNLMPISTLRDATLQGTSLLS